MVILLILPQRNSACRGIIHTQSVCKVHLTSFKYMLPPSPQQSRTRKPIVPIFINFLFCIGVQPVNNVVTVSSGQHGDSVTYIHVSILPQTALPSRLPHNNEQNSLCYTVGTCWLCVLNVAVCACPSQYPFPTSSLPATISLSSKSVSLFLFCKYVTL